MVSARDGWRIPDHELHDLSGPRVRRGNVPRADRERPESHGPWPDERGHVLLHGQCHERRGRGPTVERGERDAGDHPHGAGEPADLRGQRPDHAHMAASRLRRWSPDHQLSSVPGARAGHRGLPRGDRSRPHISGQQPDERPGILLRGHGAERCRGGPSVKRGVRHPHLGADRAERTSKPDRCGGRFPSRLDVERARL